MSDDFKMLSAVPMMQPRRVITRSFTNQSTEYTIRITRPIGEIDEFEEEIMALEEATENDIVMVQLSSPGGSLETCDFLCRRINECAAPVFVEIGLTCASAASAMCLQADDWKIHDSSTMMVHACSYSPGYGKESDVRSSVENTARINKEWVERTYKGFLTDDELEKVLDGKDLYFYADDLRERLPAYRDFREEMEQCLNPDCTECSLEQDSIPSIDSIIETAVASGLEQGLAAVLKKYELVERPKKSSRAKNPTTERVDKKLKEDLTSAIEEKKPSTKTKKALDEAKLIKENVETSIPPLTKEEHEAIRKVSPVSDLPDERMTRKLE